MTSADETYVIPLWIEDKAPEGVDYDISTKPGNGGPLPTRWLSIPLDGVTYLMPLWQ
jgi:hypothetical protein